MAKHGLVETVSWRREAVMEVAGHALEVVTHQLGINGFWDDRARQFYNNRMVPHVEAQRSGSVEDIWDGIGVSFFGFNQPLNPRTGILGLNLGYPKAPFYLNNESLLIPPHIQPDQDSNRELVLHWLGYKKLPDLLPLYLPESQGESICLWESMNPSFILKKSFDAELMGTNERLKESFGDLSEVMTEDFGLDYFMDVDGDRVVIEFPRRNFAKNVEWTKAMIINS